MPRCSLAILVLAPALAVALPAGCAPTERVGADPQYPYGSKQAEVLDIQVVLKPTRLRFTNTTARAFGPTRIWLNQRFSQEVDAIGVGESFDLKLSGFRDEFGEKWRGGGFWASELPERLVLAQLEPLADDSTDLLGMVVVTQQEQ